MVLAITNMKYLPHSKWLGSALKTIVTSESAFSALLICKFFHCREITLLKMTLWTLTKTIKDFLTYQMLFQLVYLLTCQFDITTDVTI